MKHIRCAGIREAPPPHPPQKIPGKFGTIDPNVSGWRQVVPDHCFMRLDYHITGCPKKNAHSGFLID